MIYIPDAEQERAGSALAKQISAQVSELGGLELLGDPGGLEEVARAVECFLERNGGDGSVESRHVLMLASQALSSVGEGAAARRLLVFGTGLVRPSEWEVVAGDRMWVLDLRQMTVRADDSLEMVFFGSLNIVLEAMADIWDETGGEGVLGLRNVCAAACALLGSDACRKRVDALVDEIHNAARTKLNHLGALRGWDEIPQVMNLDL